MMELSSDNALDLLQATTSSKHLYCFDLRELIPERKLLGVSDVRKCQEAYTQLTPRSLQLEHGRGRPFGWRGRSLRSQRTLGRGG